MTKYNFGCGNKYEKGYVNVDALNWSVPPDVLWDLSKVPYEFADDNSADEILAIEVLEHLSFRDTVKVLGEWKRILKVNGKLTIQVPDCGKMMEYYVDGKICSCVEHKPKDEFEGYGKESCFECGGRGRINPTRWLYAFTGAQKTGTADIHKNIFTKQILSNVFDVCKFRSYEIKSDKRGWKLIAEATK